MSTGEPSGQSWIEIAFTYAWWLTGDDEKAETAVRAAAGAAGSASPRTRTEVALEAVRAHVGRDVAMGGAAEIALLHDVAGMRLPRAAAIAGVSGTDAPALLAKGRLEALATAPDVTVEHPDRLGGLAVGNRRDASHARQCASCRRVSELLNEGRDELIAIATVAPPAQLVAELAPAAIPGTPGDEPPAEQEPPEQGAPAHPDAPEPEPVSVEEADPGQAVRPEGAVAALPGEAHEPEPDRAAGVGPDDAAATPPEASPVDQVPDTQATVPEPAPAQDEPSEPAESEAVTDVERPPVGVDGPALPGDDALPDDEDDAAEDRASGGAQEPDRGVGDHEDRDREADDDGHLDADDEEEEDDEDEPRSRVGLLLVVLGVAILVVAALLWVFRAEPDAGAPDPSEPAVASSVGGGASEPDPAQGTAPTEASTRPSEATGAGGDGFQISAAGVVLAGQDEPAPSGQTLSADDPISLAVEYRRARDGVRLEAEWTVGGELYRAPTVTLTKSGRHTFVNPVPAGGWPPGEHHVILITDGGVVGSIDFRVE